MQRAVDNPALPPRVILGDIVNQLAQNGDLLPKTSRAFVRSVQRARVNHGGHPVVPQTFDEAVDLMPEKYNQTATRERFFRQAVKIYEDSDEGLMLFMSPQGKDVLRGSKVWLADGTFLTSPVPFSQVSNFACTCVLCMF